MLLFYYTGPACTVILTAFSESRDGKPSQCKKKIMLSSSLDSVLKLN